MADRAPSRRDSFFFRVEQLRRQLPAAMNRAGVRTADWLEKVAKSNSAFVDQTGSLRKSIRGGVLVTANRTRDLEVAITAGYPDIGYSRDDGTRITTDLYAASIERGGPNPWTGKNNTPRPFIAPTAGLAASLQILEKMFFIEFEKMPILR